MVSTLAPESTGRTPCHCIEPWPELFPASEFGTACAVCGGHLDADTANRAGAMRLSRAFDAARSAQLKPSGGIAGLDVRVLS